MTYLRLRLGAIEVDAGANASRVPMGRSPVIPCIILPTCQRPGSLGVVSRNFSRPSGHRDYSRNLRRDVNRVG